MNNILQSKIILAAVFLIVGAGVGNQLPVIKIMLDKPVEVAASKQAGCDGVPCLADIVHPKVNGVAMSRTVYLAKYCGDKPFNKTCLQVVTYNRTHTG